MIFRKMEFSYEHFTFHQTFMIFESLNVVNTSFNGKFGFRALKHVAFLLANAEH
jgi:hypothetical protein